MNGKNPASAGQIKQKLGQLYQKLNRLMGGAPEMLRQAYQNFGQARGGEAAASMAYYTFFSLFPLLLLLSSILGYILYSGNDWTDIVNNVTRFVPIQAQFIQQNLLAILKARNAVGAIGLVGLIWSASGAFSALAININRAWSVSDGRSFFADRLLAVGMIAVIVLVLVIFLVASSLMSLLPNFNIPLMGSFSIYYSFLWKALVRLVPWAIACLVFYLLYKLLPTAYVKPRAAFWAALVAGIAWEILTSLFTWYLGSGIASYKAVYGSLGTIVALLTWIYLSAWITIFGAHLSAVISHQVEKRVAPAKNRRESTQRRRHAA
jgi:membrane protein